jgi:hypothetical protein
LRSKSIFSFSLLATLIMFACSSLAWSSCVTSSDTGQCPASGAYPQSSSFSESNGSNTYVQNGVTGGYGISPETQTLTANSGSSWSVSSDFGTSTHQLAYPETEQNYNGEAVSSFTNIVGTVNETTPHNSNTGEEVGFFLYLNNYGNTIEIQHDIVNESQCNGTTPVKTGISFGGSYGVPTNSWDLCYNGSFYYWQYDGNGASSYGFSSGSVELISMIKYLETNGYLPSSSTVTMVEYGFMIYTTKSNQETFTVNNYTLINNASSGSPTISLSPTSLSFSATVGGANPASQNVTVSNSGGGTLASPTTAITYTSGSGWLTVTCTGSSAPYTCKTQPATGSLAAGTYNATVKVSSSGATNSPQSYTVAFTVNPVSSPTISLSPTSLSFSANVGGSNPASQNVTVSNSGGGTLAKPTTAITYNSGSGWLSVTVQGSSAPFTLLTQPTTGSLAAGTYNATVKVTSTGATNSPQSYTVAFTVNSGSTCDITGATSICPSSGLYYDTSLSPTTWGQITQNDVWNPPSSWTQDMYTTNPSDWYIEANFPADSSGAIKSYPSTAIQYYEDGQTSDPNPTLDSFTEIVGAFSESAPAASTGTVSDIGYDLWFNDWASEIMIQHQNINTDVCTDWTTVIATDVQFGGTNGVPVEHWNLCQNGTFGSSNPELIWQYYATAGSKTFGESSGSVDIDAMLKYLEGNSICKTSSGTTDCLPASSTLTQFGYGFEISTTNGNTQQFTIDSLTQTAVE